MSKVINIKTKQPMEGLPFDKEIAEGILEHIFSYKISDENVTLQERTMVHEIIAFIENNSGIKSLDVLDKFTKKQVRK
jgi:hypothetical protein